MKLVSGTFLERTNRFIAVCEIDSKVERAYMPNPGRMWELLFPGVKLYLTPNAPEQKTRFTVVAVERYGEPIMLHTHWNNDVAEKLLQGGKIAGLETARVVRREVKVGHHRFDFLLEQNGKPYYLEVKSCTLFEKNLAMFPDAVTKRGKEHIETLTAMAESGVSCGVLFVIHWPKAEYFLPDFHTDLAFAQAFCRARHKIDFYPAAVRWNEDLTFEPLPIQVQVPWRMLSEECQDGGSYLMLLHLPETKTIEVGSLGIREFPAGYYLYVGTAKRNLTKRLERHCRRRKRKFWHIDYLREAADQCLALPIRTTERIEHELAKAVSKLADWQIDGFGASDCQCPTHLFAMSRQPLQERRFIELLQFFRIERLAERLNGPKGGEG